MCLVRWQLKHHPYTDKLRTDDGTCKIILSDECIADINKAADVKEGFCECPKPHIIPSYDALDDDVRLMFERCCAANHYDASHIRGWEDGNVEVYAFEGDSTHTLGTTDDYNYYGSLPWPVMASFSNTSFASLSCVRATDAVNGS